MNFKKAIKARREPLPKTQYSPNIMIINSWFDLRKFNNSCRGAQKNHAIVARDKVAKNKLI